MEEQEDILTFPQSLTQSYCKRIYPSTEYGAIATPCRGTREFRDILWLTGLVKIARTVDNDYPHLSFVFHFLLYCCVAMPRN